MKNLKDYFKKAEEEQFAIPQFNFSDYNQLQSIVAVAARLKSPVILGTSEGESKFFGMEEAVALRDILRKKTGASIFLNLDHGKSLDYIKLAIKAGYDMVQFDGSKLSFEENVKTAREVVKAAKAGFKHIFVEGEIGIIGTDASKLYQESFQIKEEDLTKPEDAVKFAKETKVDALAISVGTFHGMDMNEASPHIRLDRLEEISKAVKIPLVLHGGSGTPEEDLKKAIQLGIAKININTESRLAFTSALRKALENQEEITPYRYLPKAKEAMEKVVEEKIRLFGSEGKA